MSLNVVSALLSIASFLVSIAATWIAASSLSQAKRVAQRAQGDWKQRKWFDLYFSASEIHDSLDHFQAQYVHGNAAQIMGQRNRDENDLMFLIRKTLAMAVVFPRTQAITDLYSAASAFKDRRELTSKERLSKIFDAVEGLRQKAVLDPTVLD